MTVERPFDLAPALTEPHVLGEGVRWWSAADAVVWVDIVGCRIRRARLDGTGLVDVTTTDTTDTVGFVAPTTDGTLLAGVGLDLVEVTDDGIEVITSIDHRATVSTRCNDGAVDPVGRLFVGVLGREERAGHGALHRVDGTETVAVLTGMTIPNGLGWSPDGETMYVTDSASRRIDAHPYDCESGTLGAARRFVEVQPPGVPDGLCMDVEGFVWSAIWGAGEVHRYAPDGSLDRVVAVPARQPSSCAFCGTSGDVLVVASATEGMSTVGSADGWLFAGRPGVSGPPPYEAVLPTQQR